MNTVTKEEIRECILEATKSAMASITKAGPAGEEMPSEMKLFVALTSAQVASDVEMAVLDLLGVPKFTREENTREMSDAFAEAMFHV